LAVALESCKYVAVAEDCVRYAEAAVVVLRNVFDEVCGMYVTVADEFVK